MKNIFYVALISIVFYSCSSTVTTRIEIPNGVLISNDSIYYSGYLSLIESWKDSVVNIKKTQPFGGKFTSSDGRTLDSTQVAPEFVPVDKMPQSKIAVAPNYPERAKIDKIEGLVWTRIWVDEKGVPRLATILESTNSIFNRDALIAALNYTFLPAVRKNESIAVYVSVPFRFKLNR